MQRSLLKDGNVEFVDITEIDISDERYIIDYNILSNEIVKDIKYKKDDSLIVGVSIILESGRRINIDHFQECCEVVQLVDVAGGKLEDIIGERLIKVNLSSRENKDEDDGTYEICYDYSNVWTFITISTFNTDLTLRWHGSSNGYYSENMHIEFDVENGKYEY